VLPSFDATTIIVPSGENEICTMLPVETWSACPTGTPLRASQKRTWPSSVATASKREPGG